MKPGDRVRLKSDPARIGLLTGETEERAGRVRILVRFFDGEEEFVPELGLEVVLSDTASPGQLITQGRFGRARDLRGALTFYRLSGRLADLIYSMNATTTDFYAYQFKPVLNFLDSPCNGLLIADEVGLGKTIEAGLIWTELRARVDARRLLVLCPAMLREKWQAELANRFGITAHISNAAEVLTRVERIMTHTHEGFALVASLQGLRPPRGWDDEENNNKGAVARLAQFLRSNELNEPLFDLVIIDEAHYLRNPETQMARLGRLLRPITESLLLLSATPIQLRSEDLFHLLNLLDSDTFPYPSSFSDILQANAPIVHLRDRLLAGPMTREEFLTGVRKAVEYRIFSDNVQLSHMIDNLPSEEALSLPAGRAELADRLDRINPMAKVVSRTRKRDVQIRRVVRSPVAYKVQMTAIERIFYGEVTDRVREFCAQYDIAEGFMLTIPQRQMASCMAAACRSWLGKVPQELAEEIRYEAVGDQTEDEPSKSGPLLDELVRIVHEVGDYAALRQHDSKYSELLRRIQQYLREYPDNKLVLFAFYRDTLHYLHERLSEDGVASIVLHGGMDKHAAIYKFGEPAGPSILLSSEIAAEGVDLQFASLLVNYDLPWNPMKIEQRIGRLDRIGQKEDRIVIWNLMYAETIDERVYDRLLERLDVFKHALGSIEAMLGEEIREMSYELLRHKLTPDQEQARIDQTAQAIAYLDRQQDALEKDAIQLIAHGEYIENKINAAQDLGRYISGQDLYLFVREFFDRQYEGCRFLQLTGDDLLFEIELTAQARVDLRQFVEAERPARHTTLLSDTGNPRMRFIFKNRVGGQTGRTEVISQDHPVVRFVSARLRALGKGYYFPVSALELSSLTVPDVPENIYVYAVNRWTVSGARDIERLVFCTCPIDEPSKYFDSEIAEKLVATAAMQARDWYGASNVINAENAATAYDGCLERLEHNYHEFKEQLQRENLDRVNLMISTLQKHRDFQTAKREEIIARHRASGQQRLIPAEEGKIRQLSKRVEERVLQLRQKSHIKSSQSNVSGGLINLV